MYCIYFYRLLSWFLGWWVGMGRWGKNKCAANVCRLMCVGFAALLFLRSVGCIVMLVVLVTLKLRTVAIA